MLATRKKSVNLEVCRQLLLQKRKELINRLFERRSQTATEHETDDESLFALQTVTKDLAATNMEREIRTLAEVELSLRLLERGQYGFCGGCGEEIPAARLQALPWTRICVVCAGGGINPAVAQGNDAFGNKDEKLPGRPLRFEKRRER